MPCEVCNSKCVDGQFNESLFIIELHKGHLDLLVINNQFLFSYTYNLCFHFTI